MAKAVPKTDGFPPKTSVLLLSLLFLFVLFLVHHAAEGNYSQIKLLPTTSDAILGDFAFDIDGASYNDGNLTKSFFTDLDFSGIDTDF